MTNSSRLLAAAVVAVAWDAATAGAQQPAAAGTITGRVTEQGSGAPLSAAQVFVVGTTRGSVTGENGSYRILGVPAGTVQLRVRRLGYEPATQTVTVAPGATATADFTIGRAAATQLEQVVVTATGESQRLREQGSAPARVELAPERLPAVPSFSQALSGQAAGVQVLQSSGTAGTGSRIRIRGTNSLTLSNEPLIVIDGVRVQGTTSGTGTTGAFSIGIGGQSPSRLDDINPEEIESIEVLKGPAASGLYGTQAANGVIQITTKKGRAGRTQWTTYAERGLTQEVSPFPANYGGWFTNEGEREIGCDLTSVAAGFCTQDSLAVFNPLKDPRTTPFRDGARTQLGLNVAGGNERIGYFLSGESDREAGIYETNALNRTNLRANLRAFLTEDLDVNVSTGYVRSQLQLPGNDNTFLGYISNGLAGFPRIDDPGAINGDGYDPLGPASLAFYQNFQRTNRAIGSLQTNWRPAGWLRVTGIAGFDQSTRFDTQYLPPERVDLDQETREGYRTANRFLFSTYTAQATATADFALTEALRSTTTLSFQYQQEGIDGVRGTGFRIVAGTGSLEGTVSRPSVGEDYFDNRLAGGIVQQQLAWRDRLFLSLGVRGDDNSAFGENFTTVYYPTAQLSWVASEQGWFPRLPGVSSVRLRGAYGRSGLRPGALDALNYFDPVPARVRGQDVAAITVGGLGDPNLRPEITTEIEGGADVTLFGDRVSVNATGYNRRSKDALVRRVVPPSVGVTRTRFENVGTVRNLGVELLGNVRALDRRNAQLDFTLNYSYNRPELLSLAQGVDPILLTANGSQRVVPGYAPGAYWGRRITGYETSTDGRLVSEVQYADTAEYLGDVFPRTLTSLQTTVSLFRWLRASALLDYRGGHKQYNASEDFRCGIGRCRGVNDPSAPLALQARSVASLVDGEYAGWIEDASFVRFREASLTFTLPERLAGRLARARGVSLTLAGNNLAVWTDYSGVDPEVNSDAQSNFIQSDFLSQAPIRRWSARFNVNF